MDALANTIDSPAGNGFREVRERFNDVARDYDRGRRQFIPCFDAFYGEAAELVRQSVPTPRLVFDLGAGTGLLADFWVSRFPSTRFVLVDLAEEMLDIARRRFAGRGNVSFVAGDYAVALPDGRPDVILSGLSIHHLTDADKRTLFRRVRAALAAGGVFVNHDQFRHADPALEAAVERAWREKIDRSGLSRDDVAKWLERKALDRECTVPEELEWLREAGFGSAECLFRSGKFAVVLARAATVTCG